MALASDANELKVFISNRESACGECGEDLGPKAWITLAGEKGAVCLACALHSAIRTIGFSAN